MAGAAASHLSSKKLWATLGLPKNYSVDVIMDITQQARVLIKVAEDDPLMSLSPPLPTLGTSGTVVQLDHKRTEF